MFRSESEFKIEDKRSRSSQYDKNEKHSESERDHRKWSGGDTILHHWEKIHLEQATKSKVWSQSTRARDRWKEETTKIRKRTDSVIAAIVTRDCMEQAGEMLHCNEDDVMTTFCRKAEPWIVDVDRYNHVCDEDIHQKSGVGQEMAHRSPSGAEPLLGN